MDGKVNLTYAFQEIPKPLGFLPQNKQKFPFRLLQSCSNAESARAELPQHNPGVVLMGINLPGADGVECVGNLKAKLPVAGTLRSYIANIYRKLHAHSRTEAVVKYLNR
jgi:DNA-binding NarL/FixJ family response regulator